MLLPFDYNLLILVIEHAYMVCPGTFIVLFWKLKGTSVYWPWSKGIHSNETKSPNWLCLLTSETKFLGFFGPLGTKTIDFWFARAIPWPTTRPTTHDTNPPLDSLFNNVTYTICFMVKKFSPILLCNFSAHILAKYLDRDLSEIRSCSVKNRRRPNWSQRPVAKW